jgi:tetratricopeptide (TPR) repeat protein
MRKFLAATGFILLTAALAAGGWWAWPILFPSLPSGWLSTLARADAALLENRPDLAKAALDPLPSALPVSGWLQWEKRVARTAALTKDWKWATESAAPAHAQYPGNTDLTAFEVWALLQDHRAAEALPLAEKVLKGTPWDSLRIQATVEAAGLATEDWSDLRGKLADPGVSDVWDKLSGVDSSPEVNKNALLAALADGRMDAARAHLDALSPLERDKPPFDRLQALMAYDQGDFGRAAALLKSLPHQPDMLLVLADVYLHLGDPDQARLIYDELLAEEPNHVPLALAVNRAELALDDDPQLAVNVLSRVTEGFDQAGLGKVKLLTLEARFRMGETDAVRVALDRLVAGENESALGLDAELLKGRLMPEWSSVPRLWSLLHRHPESQPLAERLTWLLLAGQDYDGAHRALDLHAAVLNKEGQDPPWWVKFLQGLIFAAENKLPQASDALASVPAPWRDATFWADWALIASVSAQLAPDSERESLLNDALERFNRALDELPPSATADQLKRRSLWLTRRGEVQTALVPLSNREEGQKLKDAARRDLTQAVQLDTTNLKAAFLLRQILAVTQEKS